MARAPWPLGVGTYTIILRKSKGRILLGAAATAKDGAVANTQHGAAAVDTSHSEVTAHAKGDLAGRLRLLTDRFPCVSVVASEAGDIVTVTLAISPDREEYAAVMAVLKVVNTCDIAELEISHVAPGSTTPSTGAATGGVLQYLHCPSIRRLRCPSLHSVAWGIFFRLPPSLGQLQSVVLTAPFRSLGVQIDHAARCFGLNSLRNICLRDDPGHPASHCTCWDGLDEPRLRPTRGNPRKSEQYVSAKLDALRETMATRQRAIKATRVAALNVLLVAEYARAALPPEVWAMVWEYLGDRDPLTPTQVKQAAELGASSATLAKRAGAMRHLHGADFDGELDEWLVDEGFVPAQPWMK